MEPISQVHKMDEFLQKNMPLAEQNERQKQYQQLLFEAKIYDLNIFNKMNLLFNIGNNVFLFSIKFCKKGKDLQNNTIIFFLGEHFPSEKKLIEKVLYFFIFFLDDIVEK